MFIKAQIQSYDEVSETYTLITSPEAPSIDISWLFPMLTTHPREFIAFDFPNKTLRISNVKETSIEHPRYKSCFPFAMIILCVLLVERSSFHLQAVSLDGE
jgi:hypothetical protein